MFYSFLFSFQCPLTRLSRRVLIYTTIHFSFCKAFSLSFFIFFPVYFLFPLCIDVFYPSLFLPFFLLCLIYCAFTTKEGLFSVLLIKIIYHLFLFVFFWLLFRSISLFFSTRIYFTFFHEKRLYAKKNSCLDKQLFLTY